MKVTINGNIVRKGVTSISVFPLAEGEIELRISYSGGSETLVVISYNDITIEEES